MLTVHAQKDRRRKIKPEPQKQSIEQKLEATEDINRRVRHTTAKKNE